MNVGLKFHLTKTLDITDLSAPGMSAFLLMKSAVIIIATLRHTT